MSQPKGSSRAAKLRKPNRRDLLVGSGVLLSAALLSSGARATLVPDKRTEGSLKEHAMFKLMLVLSRRADLSVADFSDAWLAERRLAGGAPSLLRRVYNIPAGGAMPVKGAPAAAFDGVEEMWFETRAAAVGYLTQLNHEASAGASWWNLLDHQRTSALGGQVHIMWESPEVPTKQTVKLLILAARRPAMSVAAFREHWIDRHGPLALAAPGAHDALQRVEYCPADPIPSTVFSLSAFDGVGTIQFRSPAAMQAQFESSYYRDVVAPDEPRFTDPSRSRGSPVSEVQLFMA